MYHYTSRNGDQVSMPQVLVADLEHGKVVRESVVRPQQYQASSVVADQLAQIEVRPASLNLKCDNYHGDGLQARQARKVKWMRIINVVTLVLLFIAYFFPVYSSYTEAVADADCESNVEVMVRKGYSMFYGVVMLKNEEDQDSGWAIIGDWEQEFQLRYSTSVRNVGSSVELPIAQFLAVVNLVIAVVKLKYTLTITPLLILFSTIQISNLLIINGGWAKFWGTLCRNDQELCEDSVFMFEFRYPNGPICNLVVVKLVWVGGGFALLASCLTCVSMGLAISHRRNASL